MLSERPSINGHHVVVDAAFEVMLLPASSMVVVLHNAWG